MKNYGYDGDPSKNDYASALKWIAFGSFILIATGTGFYFWQRNVGSNMERDLALNSGRREFAEMINLNKAITACESAIASKEMLKAQRDQYSPDSEAYRMANVDVLGTDAAIAQCSGSIQTILDTTEVEDAPEFAGAADRIEQLNQKL